MTDYDDYIELALDIAESGSVLLVFEGMVGPRARFGYHRGQWTLALDYGDDYAAVSVDRDDVYDAIQEEDELSLVRAARDEAWQWLVQGGTDQCEMYRSHCMCGEFKYSSDTNVVQRWVRNHREDCYHDPRIQYDYDE